MKCINYFLLFFATLLCSVNASYGQCSGAPTGGSAVSSAPLVVASATFNLSLSGSSSGTGISYQWQISSCGSSWANIGGATAATLTGVSQSAANMYRCMITCSTSGISTPSIPVWVGRVSSSYCAFTASTNCGFGDGIAGFSLSGACGTSVSKSTAGCLGQYENYTNQVIKMIPGSSYSGSMISGYSGQNAKIYIDFNDNGSFEAAEQVWTGVVGTSSVGVSFTVPAGATYGIHQMRALAVWNTTATSGCYSTTYGTACDFTCHIIPANPTVSSTSPACASALVLTASPSIGCGAIYNWSGPGFSGATAASNTLTGVPGSGTYNVSLTVNGATSCATGSTAVTLLSSPSIASLTNNSPLCAGTNLTLTANTPVNVASYAWAGPVAVSGGASATVTSPTTSANGNYTLTVTASGGCTAQYVTTAVVNPKPTIASLTPSSASLCTGNPLTLNANTVSGTGALTSMTWTGPNAFNVVNTASSTSFTPTTSLASGLYSVVATYPGLGCASNPATASVAVNTTPTPITGGSGVICSGTSTSMSSTPIGGTWYTGSTDIATVSVTGTVLGVSGGETIVTYAAPGGCTAFRTATVNPTPAYTVTPSTPTTICLGETVAASLVTSPLMYSLLTQNFNTGLGNWTTQNISGPAGSHWALVSSPAPLTGLVGDGTSMLQSNPLALGSATNTTLTSPSFSTIGYGAATLYFNGYLLSDNTDMTVKVEYSTNGGSSWNNVVDLRNTVMSGTTWSAATPQYSVALPAGAIGSGSVILRWNYNGQYTWAIDNISVKVQLPSSTLSWTGPAGLSCGSCSSVDITPTATGSNVYNGVVNGSAGCNANASVTVSVNALPTAISGNLIVCENATNILTSSPTGTWNSGDITKATIGSGTGALTGVAAGTANITYTASASGCRTYEVTTVLPAPSVISPATASICLGNNLALTSTPTGGIWTSSSTPIAPVGSSTGTVGGASAGSATITYTLPSGCASMRDVTVNPLPATISGANSVCVGASTPFTNSDPLGTWMSDNSSIASVNMVTGLVLGETQGNTYITYTLPTGCYTVKLIQVNPLPLATTGAGNMCVGATTVLFNSTGGGLWTSTAPAIASVNSSGVVTAGSFAGSVDIHYTVASTGCRATHNLVVNPLPQVISGPSKVCKDATIALSDADPFGSWNSADATIASVDGAGLVMGVSIGNTLISYTLPTGCMISKSVSVNALPNNINGVPAVCYGATTNMLNTTPSGAWSSSDPSVATISATGMVTPVASLGGSTTISYIVAATGCFKTHDIQVNPLPASIDGTTTLCHQATTTLSNTSGGGIWNSGNSGVLLINATSGAGTAVGTGSTNVTYTLPTGCRTTAGVQVNPLPGDIFGTLDVCAGRQTTLGTTSTGGNWTSSDPSVASVNGSGTVTGAMVTAAGTSNISYTFSTGCYKIAQVSVNPLPGTISGNFSICVGATSDLSSPDGGGTWTSSTPTVAPVNVIGTVNGNNAGGTIITYTLPTGCMRTQAVVVNPLPGLNTGTASACEGLTSDLNNATPNGTWSSDNTSIATVDPSSGLVMGEDEGTTNIVYTLPTGCARSRAFVVNPTPDAIGGTLSACPGQTSQLNSDPSNGTWTSGSSSVASINALGLVTANGAGAANITYTLPAGCRTISTFVVNPLPGSITGTRIICQGGNSTLSNATPNGVWSTQNGFVATIDGGTGAMNGAGAGVTTVTYTISSTGCARSANVTVNALPNAITGITAMCAGSTTNLSTTSTGGTWSSNNAAVASVSNTGVVTGNSAGSADIAYTFATGCRTTATVVVNGLPADITGATSVCLGQQATVLNTTGSGSWSIDNPSVLNIDVNGVVTGMGVGAATVKYTIDLTGCYKTKPFTVNALPAAIMGTTGICQSTTTMLSNATPNGTWSSSNTGVGQINSSTGVATGLAVGFSIIQYTLPTGCSSNATLVVNALPDPITGTASMCVGASTQLESNTTGGTWSSSSATATVNTTGLVNGVAAGSAIISYTTGNGCRRIRLVNVNPLPSLIGGTPAVCPGLTTTLSNTVNGGTWSSDDLAVATISSTGVVTPMTTTGGTSNIIYTLPTGCSRTKQVTVHAAVDAISGAATVCKGSTIALTNTMTGGAWSSSNTAVATVAAGTVTGAGAGVTTIVYTMPTGCTSTMQVVVNPLPGSIGGATAVCNGSTVSLGNTVSGGAWTSSDDTKATVSSTGAVTGVDAGMVTITYTLPTTCMMTRSMVVNALPAVKNVTGGGSYCQGGTGVAIGVDGSEPGMLYKLMNGGTIPVITMTGTGAVVNFGDQTGAGTYMAVAVSPEGCMQNMTGTATVSINPLIAPSVTISSDKGNTVCAGTSVVYTATGVDGGTTPAYAWLVNGTDMGATAAHTYVPVNGDIVSVRFTSSEACASPASATAQMAMTVRANLLPAVTIAAEPGNKLCAGQTATYRATIENGGAVPTYTWLVDGTIITGATNAMYSYMPDNADLVVCKLNSSYSCASDNNVASNSITMEMAPVFVPVIVVNATPGTVVEEGTEVTYTATVSNAGTSPEYQWLINLNEVAGATNPVFKTANLKDGDSVTCRVQGTGECSKSSINSVVMKITPATGVTTTMIGNSEIRLVPNPNSGAFTVSGTLATKADEAVMFEVTNMLGQVVYKGNTTAKNGVVEARIELGNTFANGMYMLNMVVGTERKSFHFVMKQ